MKNIILAIIILLFLGGCAATEDLVGFDAEKFGLNLGKINKRIQEKYTADANYDTEAYISYVDPSFKKAAEEKGLTMVEFLGLDTKSSGTQTDTDIVAKATRICGCNDDVTDPHYQTPYTRCTIQFHIKEKTSGEEADIVEVWNYKDGEWYWFWTAHFNQC